MSRICCYTDSIGLRTGAVKCHMLLKHICPVCGKVIPISQSRCPEHPSRHKDYDDNVRYTRDKKYHSFYLTSAWEAVKASAINKANGICIYTFFFEKKLAACEEVHHIVPLKDDWGRRLDVGNLIPLTHRVHMQIEKEYREGEKAKVQSLLFDLKRRFESGILTVGEGKKVSKV